MIVTSKHPTNLIWRCQSLACLCCYIYKLFYWALLLVVFWKLLQWATMISVVFPWVLFSFEMLEEQFGTWALCGQSNNDQNESGFWKIISALFVLLNFRRVHTNVHVLKSMLNMCVLWLYVDVICLLTLGDRYS